MAHAELVTTPRSSFWLRQFSGKSTTQQVVFDIVFGIVLPLVCVVFDPIVFRGAGGLPWLLSNSIAAYVGIGIGIVSLLVWLSTHLPAKVLTGALAASAVFSFGLGVLLLPLSLMGLFILIGALGFIPFVTSFVFFRNTVRAIACARTKQRHRNWIVVACFSFALALTAPAFAQFWVKRDVASAMEQLLANDSKTAQHGLERLRRFAAVHHHRAVQVAISAEYCGLAQHGEPTVGRITFLLLPARHVIGGLREVVGRGG